MLSILDRQITSLLVEPIKADLKLTDTQIGLLQGIAFAIFYSIAGLPIGWAVDRFPRRIILYIGITFWSLSTAACGLANSFWQLFVGRTSVGVGEATLTPSAVSLIGDLFPPERSALPFGVYGAGFFLGSGAALGLGGLIVGLFVGKTTVDFPVVGEIASWQAVFLVTGLPGVLIAFLAAFIHDPRADGHVLASSTENATITLMEFLRLRRRVVLHSFAGFALASFISYAMGAWTPAFFARRFGWAPQDIGWTFGLAMAISGATGACGGGILFDRMYRKGWRDIYFVAPGYAALVSMPFLVGGYFMPTPVMVLAFLTIGMAVISVASPAYFATLRRISLPGVRGQLSATAVLFIGLTGGGLGPVAVGTVTDRVLQDESQLGLSLSLVLAVALACMSVVLLSGRSAMRAVPDE